MNIKNSKFNHNADNSYEIKSKKKQTYNMKDLIALSSR